MEVGTVNSNLELGVWVDSYTKDMKVQKVRGIFPLNNKKRSY